MILDSSTLVLVGAWNAAILTPDWIVQEALERPGQSMPVLISFPLGVGMPPAFRLDGVSYQVQADRVVISPPTWSSGDLCSVEQIAARLCAKLPFTPLAGLGLNFDLRVPEPDTKHVEKFAVDNSLAAQIEKAPKVVASQIVKTFQFDNCLLNLTQGLTREGNLTAKFNFHYELKRASEVAAVLTGSSYSTSKARTLEILRIAFDIDENDIEEAGHHDNQFAQTQPPQPA